MISDEISDKISDEDSPPGLGLLTDAPIASLLVDDEGRVLWGNRAAFEMLVPGTLDGEHLTGLALRDLLDASPVGGDLDVDVQRVDVTSNRTLVHLIDRLPRSDAQVALDAAGAGADTDGADHVAAFRVALLDLNELSHQITGDTAFYAVLARRIVEVIPRADACRIFTGPSARCQRGSSRAATVGAHELVAAAESPTATSAPPAATIRVPIRVGDEPVGRIEVDSNSGRSTFDAEADEMVSLLARLVGDLIRRRRLELELRGEREAFQHLAYHDSLTGLPNRRRVEFALHEALGSDRAATGVLFVDVDDFKVVNDTFGHDVGDRVLVAVADTLRLTTHATDVVGRWGGDEFLVLAPQIASRRELHRLAHRILADFGSSLQLDGGVLVPCSLSIGVAWSHAGRDDITSLLARAGRALRRAKRLGKNTVGVDAP